jgi:putative oxidoreductase
MWTNLLYTNPDWIEAIVRITLRVIFFAHGAQKMLGWFGGEGLKNTMRSMHQFLGLPIPMAFLAIATEFLGGAGLILGLLSRLAALAIGVTMVTAILMGMAVTACSSTGSATGRDTASSITSWPSRWRR